MANENDDKLIIEIELDDGKLAKGFVKAKDVAGKAGKDAGKDFGDKANASALSGLSKLKATILGLVAGFSIKAMEQEAEKGQRAIELLNNSLRMTGEYTPALSAGLQSYASELSALTGKSGEAIIGQIVLAKSLNATTEQAKQITTAAQGMANALSVDASSAVMRISQTLNGTVGSLGRIIPELKNLTEEQLKSGAAIDIVNEKFKEFTAINNNVYSGAKTSMATAFMDIIKALGEIIVKSPLVIATFQVMTTSFRAMATDVTKLSSKEGLGSITEAAIGFARAVNTYLIAPLELFYNVGKFVFDTIVFTLQTVVASVAMLFGKIAELAEYFGMENGLTAALKDFAASSSAVWDDMAVKSTESFNSIFDFPFAAKTEEVISEIETVAAKVAEANASALAISNQGMRQSTAEISKTSKDIANMINNGLVRSVSTGIQAVGASFVQGGGAFKDFGNQIIGIMGDLAIQVGTAIIFTGQAIEVLRTSIATAVGIPAIAAGIALIALGGALKAFASKNSSTATSNSAIPQTGGDSFGSNPVDQTVITQPETEREKVPEININIQGDVLDSEESGRRIVDIINDAFDREGLKIRRGAIV